MGMHEIDIESRKQAAESQQESGCVVSIIIQHNWPHALLEQRFVKPIHNWYDWN
jgi:hypothetical protein